MSKSKDVEKGGISERVAGVVEPDGAIIELVHSPLNEQTQLVRYVRGEWNRVDEVVLGATTLRPYPGTHTLLRNAVVRFPERPEEFGDVDRLRQDIREFIHRYVSLNDEFEQLATCFVLLTWVFDRFNELPYLRVRGDYGTGKTRFLQVVGSLCYRPMFAGGASSVASVFHILNDFQGTLVLDEADFRFSDERAEVAKILNNGNMRGFPVLRCELDAKRRFRPRAYIVYGPKIVATRGDYHDAGLESRFLTADMDRRGPGSGIPVTLPDSFAEEATRLRNKLLVYRFRNFHRVRSTESGVVNLEPRLAQILAPLMAVSDPATAQSLRNFAVARAGELLSLRSNTPEADVLASILRVRAKHQGRPIAIKEVQTEFMREYGNDYGSSVTARWIGHLVRTKLRLQTRKSHGIYVIPLSENPKVESVASRYGFQLEPRVDMGTSETSEPSSGGPVPT